MNEIRERIPQIWEAFYNDETHIHPNLSKLNSKKIIMKNIQKKKKIIKETDCEINPLKKSTFLNDDVELFLNKVNISFLVEKENSFLNSSDFLTYNKAFPKESQLFEHSNDMSSISQLKEISINEFISIMEVLKGIVKTKTIKLLTTPINMNKVKKMRSNSINNKHLKIKNFRELLKEKFLSFSLPPNKNLFSQLKTKIEKLKTKRKVEVNSFLTTPIKTKRSSCFINFITKKPNKTKLVQKINQIQEFGKETKQIVFNNSKNKDSCRLKTSTDNIKYWIDSKEKLINRSSLKEIVGRCTKKKNIKTDSNNTKELETIPEVDFKKFKKRDKEIKIDNNKTNKRLNTIIIEKKNKMNLQLIKKKNFSSVNIKFNIDVNLKMNKQKQKEISNSVSEKLEKENLYFISEKSEKNTNHFLFNEEKNKIESEIITDSKNKNVSEFNFDIIDFNLSQKIKNKDLKENASLTINIPIQKANNSCKNFGYLCKVSGNNQKPVNDNNPEIKKFSPTLLNFKNIRSSQKKIASNGTSSILTPKNTSLPNSTASNSAKQTIISYKLNEKIKTIKNEIAPLKEKKIPIPKQEKKNKNLIINTMQLGSPKCNFIINKNKSNNDKIVKSFKSNLRSNDSKLKCEVKK